MKTAHATAWQRRGHALVAPSVALSVGVGMAACTSISGLDGTAHYACQAPAGIACDSVSGVYANALARRPPGGGDGGDGAAAPSASAAHAHAHAPAPSTPPASGVAPRAAAAREDASDGQLPVRSAPRLLRLWIKPWEDSDGDLHDQAYVYVQVDPGRWQIEHVQQQLRDGAVPILPPPSSPASQAGPAPLPPATSAVPPRPAFLPPAAGPRP